jgi:hypothetical protein
VAGAAGNGRIFDLGAAAASGTGEADPFPFTYKGKSYAVPPSTAWPLRVQRLLGEGDLAVAISELLGADTARQLEDDGITLGELEILFTEVGRAAGVGGLPNSPPPARRASTRT